MEALGHPKLLSQHWVQLTNLYYLLLIFYWIGRLVLGWIMSLQNCENDHVSTVHIKPISCFMKMHKPCFPTHNREKTIKDVDAVCGDRTHDHVVKSHALYHWAKTARYLVLIILLFIFDIGYMLNKKLLVKEV